MSGAQSGRMATRGDFLKRVSTTEIPDALAFLRGFLAKDSQIPWEEEQKMAITSEHIVGFAQDAACFFKDKLLRIDNEEHEKVALSGHEFLRHIWKCAEEFGFDIPEDQIDLPLSKEEIAIAREIFLGKLRTI